MTTNVKVQAFFDELTNTVSYIVWKLESREAAIIDPVLDYDHASGHCSVTSADTILQFVTDNGLQVKWILETHAHADHLSAAPYLKLRTGAPVAIGEHIRDV